MELANRMTLPGGTRAVLWDMDGVLLDTLGLDFRVVNKLLAEVAGIDAEVDREFIRSIFAYHPPEFWERILARVEENTGATGLARYHEAILERYNNARAGEVFDVLPGVEEILDAGRAAGLAMAVVSNNPTEDNRTILERAGILNRFDLVVGNDEPGLEKKPAPDTYLHAAMTLGVPAGHCVVVEDSILGAEAGNRAGAYTVAVATGGHDVRSLRESGWPDVVYSSFSENRLEFAFGDVTRKTITTPNDFVSHMVEHIAWRLCTSMDVAWNNTDWRLLGERIGRDIAGFDRLADEGAALGMIDDGSAEVMVRAGGEGLELEGAGGLFLDWFLSLRAEQAENGRPMTELLEGLSLGLGIGIFVRVCSVEDPHHTWEGVFRSVGIALSAMYTPRPEAAAEPSEIEYLERAGEVSVLARSADYAEVARATAESEVRVSVGFLPDAPSGYSFATGPTVDVGGLGELLGLLAENMGARLRVDFSATKLASSHVVTEDVGLVVGRALKEILLLRMTGRGVNGAGSSVVSATDLISDPVRVGVSIEGRKFLKFIPFSGNYQALREQFLIGRTICGNLFTEDLDDFLDGLCGGLSASVVVHVERDVEPEEGWRMLFANLGRALAMAFAPNPYRKGVSPGVKATLS
ncbi:MAG: HAD-IA family hydrolase [Desulfatibacillaceae bacterium]